MNLSGRAVEPAGTVFNIQRFSTNDGPGLRTTVFLKGCPLSCSWCHNPESRDQSIQLVRRRERCIRCGECAEACPLDAISIVEGGVLRVTDRCEQCLAPASPGASSRGAGDSREPGVRGSGPAKAYGQSFDADRPRTTPGTRGYPAPQRTARGKWGPPCVEACGADAWAVLGSRMTAGEVLREVLRDMPFYEESGGGVTISGGEPLMQPDFLAALLTAAKLAGLHTAVDTCGAAEWAVFERILPHTDLFLYDLKVMDHRGHRRHVGAANRPILDNLARLSGEGAEVTVRLPVVPGITDDGENVARWGTFITALDRPPRVQLLPYHPIGEAKYELLEMDENREEIDTPTMGRLEEIAGTLESFGIEAHIGARWR